MMGAPADEHVHAERPFPVPRRVVLSNPIAIGKLEITVDQFSAFVATMETSAGTGAERSSDIRVSSRGGLL